jgi:hypothetical protein
MELRRDVLWRHVDSRERLIRVGKNQERVVVSVRAEEIGVSAETALSVGECGGGGVGGSGGSDGKCAELEVVCD